MATCFFPLNPTARRIPTSYGTFHSAKYFVERSVGFFPKDFPFRKSSTCVHEEYTVISIGFPSFPFQFQSSTTSVQCHFDHDILCGLISKDGLGLSLIHISEPTRRTP